MKTPEELNALKEEVENLNRKLAELTEDELKQVSGGYLYNEYCPLCGCKLDEESDEHSETIVWHVCPNCGYREAVSRR